MELGSLAGTFESSGTYMDQPLSLARPAADALEHELALVTAIARGNRRAFDQLYREYGPRIFRFAYRLIHDQTKAEEVTNDVMLEVWKSARHFERRSSVSTWILGIARHRTLNAVRNKTLHITALDEAEDVPDDSITAEVALDQATIANDLRSALDRLTPEHREVIELTYFNELSYKEIAQITNCPENTVKTRMFHAKKRLEPILAALVARGAMS